MPTPGASPEPRRRPQLPEEVAARLREQIMTGRLRPGQPLPLGSVATSLGVSVTPVREALLALRGEGFVDLEPRRGFTVAALSRRDVEDIFGVQAMIAGELAQRAATKITAAQLAGLEALQDALARTTEHDRADELDAGFHQVIGEIADAPRLSWFLGIAGRYAPRHLAATVSGWRDASTVDHQAILRALHGGDPACAKEEMHRHVARSGQLLVKHLEARGFWE